MSGETEASPGSARARGNARIRCTRWRRAQIRTRCRPASPTNLVSSEPPVLLEHPHEAQQRHATVASRQPQVDLARGVPALCEWVNVYVYVCVCV